MSTNKSISTQKEIKNENGNAVAFLSSQVSIGYGAINFSVQIIDRTYIENNPNVLKKEYDLFVSGVAEDAIANGWDALKESEVSEMK